LEGTAAPVVTVEAPPVAWLAMAAREGMAAMVVRVQQEMIATRMVSTEAQVVWVGLVATEATPSRAPQEMAALAAMAVSPVPAVLVSARLLQGKTAGMPGMADQVGLRAPGARAVLPVSEESMATAETAEMVVSLVCRAMEATEPTATRSPPMAATVARAATPGPQALAGTAVRREAALVPPEPVERMALMAPLSQAEAMAATGAVDIPIRVGMVATVGPAATGDRSATEAMAATAVAGLAMGLECLSPVGKAVSVGLADQPAEMEGSAAQVAMLPPMVRILLP